MLRILVPVDGSDNALRAVGFAVDKLKAHCSDAIELHLLNVQPPIPNGDVRLFISEEQIKAYQMEEGEKALAGAKKMLDDARVGYTAHVCVGHAAQTIAEFARDKRCDTIILGTRGLGSVMNLIMGSVATKVIHLTDVPVVLVK
jgi:nucleotide-binding universal stress UspA family protein